MGIVILVVCGIVLVFSDKIANKIYCLIKGVKDVDCEEEEEKVKAGH